MDSEALQESEKLHDSYRTNIKLSKDFDFKHCKVLDKLNTESVLQELNDNISNPYLLSYPILKKHYSDPYLELLYEKHVYNKKIEMNRSYYKMYMKNKRCDIERLKNYYENMQNLLESNPDQYFNGDYNWYYSGGNLDIVEIGDRHLVFYATKGKIFSVAAISKTPTQWSVHLKKRLQKTESNIFEIKSIIKNDVLVGIRHKNDFTLHKVNTDSVDLTSNEILKQKSVIPLVSFTINPHKNQLATVNCKQNAKITDIVTKKSESFKISKIINTLGENWSQIRYLDENSLIYANNIFYSITDLRTKDIYSALINEICPKQNFTNICLLENNIYLTTNHYTIHLDSRTHKIVNRWSHFLKSNVFISDSIGSRKNLVCLASRYPHEKVLLGSTESNIYTPVLIPNLKDSLDECIVTEPIDKSYIIRERIKYSNTGIKFVENNNNLSLFSINSIGDLSVNEINSEFDIGKNTLIFNKFSENLVAPPLNFVDKYFFKDLNKVLNTDTCDMNDYLKTDRETNVERTKKLLKKKINYCKTPLSKIWDLDFSIDDIEEIDTTTNVQAWLSRFDDTTDKDVIENIEERSNMSIRKSKEVDKENIIENGIEERSNISTRKSGEIDKENNEEQEFSFKNIFSQESLFSSF